MTVSLFLMQFGNQVCFTSPKNAALFAYFYLDVIISINQVEVDEDPAEAKKEGGDDAITEVHAACLLCESSFSL